MHFPLSYETWSKFYLPIWFSDLSLLITLAWFCHQHNSITTEPRSHRSCAIHNYCLPKTQSVGSRSGCRGDIRLFISHIRYGLTSNGKFDPSYRALFQVSRLSDLGHIKSKPLNLTLRYSQTADHLSSSLSHSVILVAVLLLWGCTQFNTNMDTLTTHPSTAQQATAFTSPASLSFPGGAGDLTPPSEKDGNLQANGNSSQTIGANGYNGSQHGGNASTGNGVTPTTPAATPGASQGVSGIVPTLQWVSPGSVVYFSIRLNGIVLKKHRRNR